LASGEFDELSEIDERLTRAFAGISAPASLASAVMNRVRMPAPTRLPEVLDAIAWMGVLSLAACVVFFVILK
jgi:predicted RNA methylase